MLGRLSEMAVSGLLNNDQTEIARKCLDEMETLLAKNTDYGSSALVPPLLAPDVPVPTAIRVRMSDKVQRAIRLVLHQAEVKSESIDDTLRDLSGYIKLYLIAREREHVQAEEGQEGQQAPRVEPGAIEGDSHAAQEGCTSKSFQDFLKAQAQGQAAEAELRVASSVR